MITMYGYQKCSTCIKARKKLDALGVEYTFYDLIEQNVPLATMIELNRKNPQGIDKLFNTRGTKFRKLKLKDRLTTMSDDEKLELLSSDGYLIKRPIVETDTAIIIGFSDPAYEKLGD